MGCNLNNIPQGLKAANAWLLWKSVGGSGGKRVKIPYYASGRRRRGRNGSPADASQLASFEQSTKILDGGQYSGLGIALLGTSPLVALDFDDCVADDGCVFPEVLELVAGTYAELSPSGHGVRAFYRDAGGVLADFANGKSLDDGYLFGFELFQTRGFVTVTGDKLLDSAPNVAEVTERVAAYCAKRFTRSSTPVEKGREVKTPMGLSEAELVGALSHIDPDCDYSTWVKVGMALHHETEGAGFALWNDWSASGEKYSSEAALAAKWDGFGQNQGSGITALSLLKEAGVSVSTAATADEFEAVTDEAEPKGGMSLPLHHWKSFAAQEPMCWLVKGLLPQADLGVIYGASGSGKTFFCA